MIGLPQELNKLFISSNNILLLTTVSSLVVWLERKQTYIQWINYLSSSVAAIYLITDFESVRNTLDPWLLPHILGWYGFAYAIAICLGCIVVDKVREGIFNFVHF